MVEDTEDPQQKMVELLKEILKWTKISSLPHVRQLLLELLPEDDNKVAYHLSDGRGSEDIAKFTGVSSSTIKRWWKIWIKAGIAGPIGVQRGDRAHRAFSLEDFGIAVPAIKTDSTKKEEVTEEGTSQEIGEGVKQ
jgi:hypothetical protein